MNLVFYTRESADGQHYFTLTEAGKTLLKSELYKQKSSCLNGIESVKKNAQEEKNYEKLSSQNGKFYFNIKASNGQVVGTSVMFTSEAERQNAVDKLVAACHKAPTKAD